MENIELASVYPVVETPIRVTPTVVPAPAVVSTPITAPTIVSTPATPSIPVVTPVTPTVTTVSPTVPPVVTPAPVVAASVVPTPVVVTTQADIEDAYAAEDVAFAEKDRGFVGLIVVLGGLAVITVGLIFAVLYYFNQQQACQTNPVVYCPVMKCKDGSDPFKVTSQKINEALNGHGQVAVNPVVGAEA